MILYWGSEAEVIGPQALRDEIAAIIKNMMGNYHKAGTRILEQEPGIPDQATYT
jgi:hypothetical protein